MRPSTWRPLAALCSLLASAQGLALPTPKPALDSVMKWIELCGGNLNGLRVQETDGIRTAAELQSRRHLSFAALRLLRQPSSLH